MDSIDLKKTITYWLQGAKKDLKSAKILYKEKQYPHALFWGHLVLEKILKAQVAFYTKKQAPYTHNLLLLADKTGLKFNKKDKIALAEINEFNLMTRYPDDTFEFYKKCTKEFSNKYFLAIKRIYKCLQKKIPLQ